jgi:hypothetical protein
MESEYLKHTLEPTDDVFVFPTWYDSADATVRAVRDILDFVYSKVRHGIITTENVKKVYPIAVYYRFAKVASVCESVLNRGVGRVGKDVLDAVKIRHPGSTPSFYKRLIASSVIDVDVPQIAELGAEHLAVLVHDMKKQRESVQNSKALSMSMDDLIVDGIVNVVTKIQRGEEAGRLSVDMLKDVIENLDKFRGWCKEYMESREDGTYISSRDGKKRVTELDIAISQRVAKRAIDDLEHPPGFIEKMRRKYLKRYPEDNPV